MSLLSLVMTGLLGCADPGTRHPPNILLVSLDTLRADHLGCYGYGRPTSPNLDALASAGALYERAIATSPWTLPSHASMFTGLFPIRHGVRSHATGLPSSSPTLASLLASHHYRTMALVNSKQLTERYGLDQGFQELEYFPERIDGIRIRSAAAQVDRAIEWLSTAPQEPVFLLLHNYDIHSDYDPSPSFREKLVRPYSGPLRATTGDMMQVRRGTKELSPEDLRFVLDMYDAGIREVDAALGSLFDFLSVADLWSETYVIVVSDHGEEFLEHGGVLHGCTMHREVLHVPLIIRGPGIPPGRRVPQLVPLTDVFSTVVDVAGVQSSGETDGSSLKPLWLKVEPQEERVAFAEADHNRAAGDDTLEMIQRGGLKLIFDKSTGTSQLFDLGNDPAETHDLAAHRPEVVSAVLSELAAIKGDFVAPGRELPELSHEERQNLQSLGYLDS